MRRWGPNGPASELQMHRPRTALSRSAARLWSQDACRKLDGAHKWRVEISNGRPTDGGGRGGGMRDGPPGMRSDMK
jgi:hypothetical protein